MKRIVDQEKSADPNLASNTNFVVFTGNQSDQAGKKRDMEEQEQQHRGFFRQPAGQRQNPPLMIKHGIQLVGE